MVTNHGHVDKYIESIKNYKETLSDPNKHLTAAEKRIGRCLPMKILSKKEQQHEKILLGEFYEDEQFLRSVYDRSKGTTYLTELSEEGFLFLTDRSDFWRNQKPIYVTLAEREKKMRKNK